MSQCAGLSQLVPIAYRQEQASSYRDITPGSAHDGTSDGAQGGESAAAITRGRRCAWTAT